MSTLRDEEVTRRDLKELPLSSAEAPRGWGRWIGEKEGALGTTGRRKGEESLFPFPAFPARFRLPSSQPPKFLHRQGARKRQGSAKEASAEKRERERSYSNLSIKYPGGFIREGGLIRIDVVATLGEWMVVILFHTTSVPKNLRY